MLTRVAQDAERALRAVEQTDGLLEDEQVADAHGLLRELIGQDFDIDDDGVPRLHRGTAPGRIISTVDPEMRHGRKSSSQRFDGYKLHAAATNSEVPLITAVEVTAASEQDGPQASGLIDQQPEHRRPSGCSATPPTAPARSAASSPTARSRCSRRSRRRRSRGAAGQARLPDRPRRRHGHLPGRAHRADRHQAIRPAARAVRSVAVSRLPAEVPLPRPPQHIRMLEINPRRSSLIAARQALDDPATAEHLRRTTAADRTAPRTARPPLRRPQDPLHRQRQKPIAGRLDRRPGQSQPDQPPPGRRNHLRAGDPANRSRCSPVQRAPRDRSATRIRPGDRRTALAHPQPQPTSSGLF